MEFPSQENIQDMAVLLRAMIMKEEAEEEFLSGAFGLGVTKFCAASPNRASHSGAIDMDAVDIEGIDYSDCEMMDDQEIKKVIRKVKREYYCDEVPGLKNVKRVSDVKDEQGNHRYRYTFTPAYTR